MRRLPLLIVALTVGCASTTTHRPDASPMAPTTTATRTSTRTQSGFPTAGSLAALAAAPEPEMARATNYLDPVRWDLPGPFPQSNALMIHQGTEPWDGLLAERLKAAGGIVVASTAMHCVAQATAEFYLEHKTYPSVTAQSFALGRCKATPSSLRLTSLSGKVPDRIDNPELFSQWKDNLQKMIGKISTSRLESVGIAFARKDGKAVFIVARGERRAFLEPVEVKDGHAIVSGRLLVADATLRASVTQGAFGYAECVADVMVALPEFKLHCPVQAEDALAWVQLASFAPGRLIGKTAATLLVAPSKALPTSFHRRSVPGDDKDVTDKDLGPLFLKAVNAARKQAGLVPLELAVEQSAMATELAPHFFSARFGTPNVDAAETILLGLRAGWKIPEMVRYGTFSASSSMGTRKLHFLVGNLLEFPFGRQTVLDPQVKKIALGPVVNEGAEFMGMLVSTYALFTDQSPKTLAAQALAILNKQRTEAGLAAAGEFPGLSDGLDRATEVLAGGSTPSTALNALLSQASLKVTTGVKGYVLERNRIDDLKWPAALTALPDLKIHISVSWYQPEGEPWGRYLIFCAYPSGKGEAI